MCGRLLRGLLFAYGADASMKWFRTMSTVARHVSKAWRKIRPYTDISEISRRLKFNRIRSRYFTRMWETAAANIGAASSKTDYGFIEVSRGGLSTFVSQSQVMLDSQLTLRVAGEKGLTYELLERLGAPMPRYVRVRIDRLQPALDFLETQKVVVVKPAGGTGGGRGVTTGVVSGEALRLAAKRASRYSEELMVEEQVSGASFRLLYLGGTFIDAVRRDPPSVIGDGRLSVQQLIATANAEREKADPVLALSPLVVDSDCRNWLEETSISLSSRPEKGAVITVKRAVNQNDVRGNINVRAQVHADIVERCGEIAQRMGIELAGVDLMCRDIEKPFTADNCWINEVNTTPGLHHHYLISKPEDGVPVAEVILEYMFANQSGTMRLGS